MSRETLAQLNTQTLIGYTSKRGQAWHYCADHQGANRTLTSTPYKGRLGLPGPTRGR